MSNSELEKLKSGVVDLAALVGVTCELVVRVLATFLHNGGLTDMSNSELEKLKSGVVDLAALVGVIDAASEMTLLGHKLTVMADQITEMTGTLAGRCGYSVEELFGKIWDS
jgi:hypothetical protein